MTKEQFFGRCLGQMFLCKPAMGLTPLKLDGVIDKYAIWNYSRNRPYDFSAEAISDCQIIGRRISQMTDEENGKYVELQQRILWEEDELTTMAYNLTDFLFGIGVFPDKYFDELKWAVEEK